jgi:uncharacterized protein
MQITHHTPGSFCWFELATSDQPGAKKFYSSLFGWNPSDSPIGPDEVYTIMKLNDRDVAAAYTMRPEQKSQGVPPNWLVYISVDDADAMAAKAASLGATVLMPAFDVMDFGRMAVIQDPQGAVFAVWQPKTHVGTGITGINTVTWADLNTTDQAGAEKFYSSLFGWKMLGDGLGTPTPGQYFHIMNGEQMIGGVSPHLPPDTPPNWMIYVGVQDCKATVSKATSLGANTYVDTMAIGENGLMAVLADPQGAVFALHQGK